MRRIAHEALAGLEDRASVEALCNLTIERPASQAGRVGVTAGYRSSDPEKTALLLFVTSQLDAYFEEDFESQNLRLAYDRACYVELNDCSDKEIHAALESAIRHQDWPHLFRAFLELPMRHGFPLLERLRGSGWIPEDLNPPPLRR